MKCCTAEVYSSGIKVPFWKRANSPALSQSSPLTARREFQGHRKALQEIQAVEDCRNCSARAPYIPEEAEKTFLAANGHSDVWQRHCCHRKISGVLFWCKYTARFLSSFILDCCKSQRKANLSHYLFPLKWILMQPQLFQVFSSVSLFL